MCPYIAGLSVNTKHRLEAFPVGVHGRTVTLHKKVIVSQPLRQMIVVYHHPSGSPNPPCKFFRLLKSSRRHGQEVESAGFRITWTLPRCWWVGFILKWQSYILTVYTSTIGGSMCGSGSLVVRALDMRLDGCWVRFPAAAQLDNNLT